VLKDYQTQRPPVKRHQRGDQAGRTGTPCSRQPRIANCERRTDQFAANQPSRSIVTTAMALAADRATITSPRSVSFRRPFVTIRVPQQHPELGHPHPHPANRRAEAPPPRRSRATATGSRGRARRDPHATAQARRATPLVPSGLLPLGQRKPFDAQMPLTRRAEGTFRFAPTIQRAHLGRSHADRVALMGERVHNRDDHENSRLMSSRVDMHGVAHSPATRRGT
jgi:hypothetical protein